MYFQATAYIAVLQVLLHPRSQGLTADTALPKALAKTKTKSGVAWKQWNAEIEHELVLINMADYKEYIGVY